MPLVVPLILILVPLQLRGDKNEGKTSIPIENLLFGFDTLFDPPCMAACRAAASSGSPTAGGGTAGVARVAGGAEDAVIVWGAVTWGTDAGVSVWPGGWGTVVAAGWGTAGAPDSAAARAALS